MIRAFLRAPDMRTVCCVVILAYFAFFGGTAVFAAPARSQAHLEVEYFRQAQKTLALLRLELPAGSYAYAHDPGAPVKPAILALRDEQGRALEVLYPPGMEIYASGVKGPVRVYLPGDALFVPLDASAGQVSGDLSFALCTADYCAFYSLDTKLRAPDGALPELDSSPWAKAFAAARPGRIVSGAGEAPAAAAGLPILSLSGPTAETAPPLEDKIPSPDVWRFQPRAFQSSLEVGGLFEALLFGLFAGLILNLMPCALPVLTLKAGALLHAGHAEAAERTRHLREHMLLFAAGIFSWFWLLALALGGSGMIWGQLFQMSSLTYGLTVLVFALGLSMLGVFNLPLIDLKAKNTGSARVQAYFAGFLATLLATPCSGPLLGGVLAWAFSKNVFALAAVFTSVGMGMALPYLCLALYPELGRFLPRPGAWLEVLERLVGFFLMALTVYLIFLLPDERRMPALASLPLVAMAAWIWGAYGGLEASVRRRRLLGALVLGLFAAAALLGLQTPEEKTEWRSFTPHAFRAALGRAPLVLVFTADWCPNCKALEHAVLDGSRIDAWEKRHGASFMRVDLTRDNAPALALLRALGSASIPFTALFPAGNSAHAPLVLRDMFTRRQFEDAMAQSFGNP